MKPLSTKNDVYAFWNKASCGEKLYLDSQEHQGFENHTNVRYQLEPYILEFADFEKSKGKKVLEIGVGLGADHAQFAKAGADLYGIDLTNRAIEMTQQRFNHWGLKSTLQTGDAENLTFTESTFDIVYSWGVLHHSPDTEKAISEVHRVLKPGGTAKIMIYQKYSIVGFMLWVRYALLKGKPFLGMDYIYSHYLESPGTKAYTIQGAQKLFKLFRNVKVTTTLTHGDLLTSGAGQGHEGFLLTCARMIWPRWLIKIFFKGNGLFMLIEAQK
jgi:SAM-dependent methyltransferase